MTSVSSVVGAVPAGVSPAGVSPAGSAVAGAVPIAGASAKGASATGTAVVGVSSATVCPLPVTWGVSHALKGAYVGALLFLLPALLAATRHVSPKIQAEADNLPSGFTFQVRVRDTFIAGTCCRTGTASFRRVAPARIACDVEPGSGIVSADPEAVSVDYVIEFRSLDYAFACFTGAMTLKEALAQRAFSTRGPNSAGVSLTYMFTAMLIMFFGWRKSYRS